ncbi:hypothetical protein B296_00020822 [Ensete ventricosum]|uniref:Uncharacterized protein n=1 Tax=Ensete ventricosum TaxID=4639 RepID=A0A426ZUV3_ENSVE|nr:hypothetical protein B296_00020822 [Ensete ventricosum]
MMLLKLVTGRVIAEDDVAEHRGDGEQNGNCSRKETLPVMSPMEKRVSRGSTSPLKLEHHIEEGVADDRKEEAGSVGAMERGICTDEEKAQRSTPVAESRSGAFLFRKNEINGVGAGAVNGVAEAMVNNGTIERDREIRKAAPEVAKEENEQS